MHACIYQDEKFPFYCELVEYLCHERLSDFVKWFSCFYWHASCFLLFMLLIQLMYWFSRWTNLAFLMEFHSVGHGTQSQRWLWFGLLVQVLCFLTDLSCLPFHCRRLGIELSNYYCWTISPFNYLRFCFMYFGTLLFYIYIYLWLLYIPNGLSLLPFHAVLCL